MGQDSAAACLQPHRSEILCHEVPRTLIDSLHANPERPRLAAGPEDWEWSSARWDAGLRPVKLEMDESVLIEPARG